MKQYSKPEAKKLIEQKYRKYMDSKGKEAQHLEDIQTLIDQIGEPLVLVITPPKKEGVKHADIPAKVMFKPRKPKHKGIPIIRPRTE